MEKLVTIHAICLKAADREAADVSPCQQAAPTSCRSWGAFLPGSTAHCLSALTFRGKAFASLSILSFSSLAGGFLSGALAVSTCRKTTF